MLIEGQQPSREIVHACERPRALLGRGSGQW